MAIRTVELDAIEISKNTRIEIKVHRMREWKIRAQIVVFLLHLISWITPFDTEIETDED